MAEVPVTPAEAVPAVQTKEVPKATQTNEIQRVAKATVYRKGKQGRELPSDQRIQADHDFGMVHFVHNVKDGTFTPPADLSEKDPDRQITIMVNGKKRIITGLISNDKNNFTYKSVDSSGNEEIDPDQTISKQDLESKMVLAYSKSMLSSTRLSVAERAVLERYVAMVKKGESAIEDLGTAALNGIITDAAKSVGMFTADDVEALAKSEIGKPQAESLRAAVSNVNVLDKPTIIRIMAENGMTASSVTSDLTRGEKSVANLKQQVEANPQDAQAKALLAQAETEVAILKQVQESLGENGALSQFINATEAGETSLEQASAVIAAFRQGDAVAMAEAVFTPIAGETPTQTSKRKAEFIKYSKQAGLFGLLALLLMGLGATEILKGMGQGH